MRTTWTRLSIAWILAILPLAVGVAHAQTTGTVNGSIKRAGVGIVGARVAIGSTSVSSYTGSAVTDQKGSFSVSGAPLGGVTVKAYDNQGNLLGTGAGTLKTAGEVITVTLNVP